MCFTGCFKLFIFFGMKSVDESSILDPTFFVTRIPVQFSLCLLFLGSCCWGHPCHTLHTVVSASSSATSITAVTSGFISTGFLLYSFFFKLRATFLCFIGNQYCMLDTGRLVPLAIWILLSSFSKIIAII